MTFKDIRLAFAKISNTQYSQEEKQSFYNLLVEHHFGLTRFEAHEKLESNFPKAKELLFLKAIQRLENNEPIQYIIGETEFYGLSFKVNKHTLIPRPETEELVAWIVEDQPNNDAALHILDIGTGSGCIAISLAKNLEKAKVLGLDISERALKIATENALINNAEVSFVKQDIIETKVLPDKYDVIVSNPPYVREKEKEMMLANVLDYEPEKALFVSNEDPLLFYRKIAQIAYKYLSENGILYFEINEYLGKEMTALLSQLGFKNCTIKKDIYGKDRMMRAIR